MSRPLLSKGVAELEALFSSSQNSLLELKSIAKELEFRSVPKAVVLLSKVKNAIAVLEGHDLFAPLINEPYVKKSAIEDPFTFNREGNTLKSDTFSQPSDQSKLMLKAKDSTGYELDPVVVGPQTKSVLDAYKVLNASPNDSWETIEQLRRQIADQSSPNQLAGLNGTERVARIAEMKLANEAYLIIAQHRTCGS